MIALLPYACAGEQGIPGPAGPAGQAGDIGDSGVGQDGEDGEAGEDGINGLPGGTGQNGTSCTVIQNGDAKTIKCSDGSEVTVVDGEDGGTPGYDYNSVAIPDLHGTDFLLSEGEYALATNPKFYANLTITDATADAAGAVTVYFNLKDQLNQPITNLCVTATCPTYPASLPTKPGLGVARLEPAGVGEASNNWVAYYYDKRTAGQYVKDTIPGPWLGAPWNVTAGAEAWLAGRKTNQLAVKLDELGNYKLTNSIAAVTIDGEPVTYGAADRSKLHRVTITLGGHSGPTATAHYDFVPDGSVTTESRDIVQTGVCLDCHGATEFHGHGGDRLTLENCMTCHTGNLTENVNVDAQSRESMDMKIMIHKIHAGGELASIPGPDGYVFDNPATPGDESVDNGIYQWWGHNNNTASWEKAAFPAVIENCTKCHSGSGADVDNWKEKPSAAACGSCHDDVDFALGTEHSVQLDDSDCATCHGPLVATGYSVVDAHDWNTTMNVPWRDLRNQPEFNVAVTLDTPSRGYYIAGESPKAYITIRKASDDSLIDHTTVTKQATAEGCSATVCPESAVAGFYSPGLFVSGPRASRNPVLTTAARAQIFSATTGPWDLSAAGAALELKVDQGADVVTYDSSGGDIRRSGTIKVSVGTTFATPATVTTDEIVNWLNGNAAFKARAVAFNQDGKVGIRSRNIGKVFAIQLTASAVATTVFDGDLAVKMPGGYYPAVKLYNDASIDPKITRTATHIRYDMDPVDDLQPGTYVAYLEIADRGRVDENNYKTPSVAKATFQVGTASVQKPPANNCDSCHQNSDGVGFVLDWSRHNKVFDQDAVDGCAVCHDYQPQNATGYWTGGHPISKRVHAVHNGSALQYPLLTVSYSNGDPVKGRNWDITYPQGVRNCETCHEDGTSSGSWATNANRLACMGCHDKDAATAHMMSMTYDPTPTAPWSGDEAESCQQCH